MLSNLRLLKITSRKILIAIKFVAVAAVLLPTAFWLAPLPERLVNLKTSQIILFSDHKLMRAFLTEDEKWRFPIQSTDLPKSTLESILCLEDKRFNSHVGVDFASMVRALYQNIKSQRIVSGASTITMQLARLTEPKARTVSSKLIEIFRSFQIELLFNKKQILDLYLTLTPFGGNLEGLETASFRFFDKSAQYLDSSEIAFLLLMPQAPNRWENLSIASLTTLRNRNLERLLKCGVIKKEELKVMTERPIPKLKTSFASHSEHLADQIKTETTNSKIVSTLTSDMQKSAEEYLKSRTHVLSEKGIKNIGLLVVDNQTANVQVAVGNFDYYSTEASQKISSLAVFRSTGSLLKPFIYGRLIETGEILPNSYLEDVPTDVDGYAPKNYDGNYSGLVEAQFALAHSLNVPWVRMLRKHGANSFSTFLFSSGIKSSLPAEKLGLSMAIGGMEMTLFDLVKLYRGLATNGGVKKLNWINKNKSEEEILWLNAGAAEMTRDALGIRGRPDFAIESEYLQDKSIRWKTGTSQGNRDAWAIGMTEQFTVGVWLGNLNGESRPALVGPEVAAPIMFDVISRARKTSPKLQASKNSAIWNSGKLENIEVCAFSGFPAGPNCKSKKISVAIKGQIHKHNCPYHMNALVDLKSGLRITKECENTKMSPQVKTYLNLPSDVNYWARETLPSIDVIPAFHPSCTELPFANGNLKIITPEPTTYILHSGLAAGKKGNEIQLPLKVKANTATSKWHCYLNGKPIQTKVETEQNILHLPVGDFNLLCVDKQGHTDQVAFAVER